MCLFSKGGAQSWGELAGEGGGTVRGKKKKGRHRMRNRERGAPVVSQLGVHVLITDVAWGE